MTKLHSSFLIILFSETAILSVMEKNWKLKLKYGKLETPYKHYTLFADGQNINLSEEFDCPKGFAIMSIKTWCESTEQAADLISYVSEQIGFEIKDKIEIYETDPQEPPKEKPFGYDIRFTPYENRSEQ
jgi:hypothetical protein